MYSTYIEIAKTEGGMAAEISFRCALGAEKIHLKPFKEAKEYVDRREDWPLDGYIWICPICGHTYVSKEPSLKWHICGP